MLVLADRVAPRVFAQSLAVGIHPFLPVGGEGRRASIFHFALVQLDLVADEPKLEKPKLEEDKLSSPPHRKFFLCVYHNRPHKQHLRLLWRILQYL